MFISFAFLTLGFITTLTIYDWVKVGRLSTNSIQKNLKRLSQAISLQEWEKAEKELSLLLEKGRTGKEISLYEIQILKGTGKFEEALQKVEIKGRIYPEELLFRLEEGQILLALQKPHEALKAFQVCAPIMRGESDLFHFASALVQAGYTQECIEMLQPFLPTTQNGQIAALAGDAFYDLKLFDQAIEKYTLALKLGYKTHHLSMQLGIAWRKFGNLAEAEKIFRTLLDKDYTDVDALLGLGACLQERGHHHKALLIFQSGLLHSPDHSILLHHAGLAALHTKKYSVAETYFLTMMRSAASDAQILSYYGLCLECQKKWQEAEQTYLKLIQHFPAQIQGYRALAWMFGVGLSQTVSHEQGMNYAYRALKLKNDPLSWEILSACSARVGDFDKAYQIQLSLAKQDKDAQTRARRQQVLRTLRKKTPLDDHHILRSLVA